MDNEKFLKLKAENEWYQRKYGPAITDKGLKNWKNLFRKPTPLEWTILIMLVLALFMGWAYQHDTQQCRYFMENITEESCRICNTFSAQQENPFILTEENLTSLRYNKSGEEG